MKFTTIYRILVLFLLVLNFFAWRQVRRTEQTLKAHSDFIQKHGEMK